MKDVDALIRETDESLRRIEALQRAKQSSPGGGAVSTHARRFSNQLMNVALAAGLAGLSMLRYHENNSNRRAIAELEGEVKKGAALAAAVEAAIHADEGKAEKKGGTVATWWGRRADGGLDERGLREALAVFRGATGGATSGATGGATSGATGVGGIERVKEDLGALPRRDPKDDHDGRPRPMI